MKKIICILLFVCTVTLSFSSCMHEHEWNDATCTSAKTCATCGETEGAALGHSYADATCTAPKTCRTCNETTGSALGHSFTKGLCDTCKYIDHDAKAEQLAACEAIISDLDTMETFCTAQTSCYKNAWYFSIHYSEDYLSYDKILADFSNYIVLDSAYVNDAIIDYLTLLEMDTTKLNGIAVIRTNSGAVYVAGKAMEDYWGFEASYANLISNITANLEKINGEVVGEAYAEAIAEYCNVVLNYYAFAKEPTGNYNSYVSSMSSFTSMCTSAKNAVTNAK